MQTPAAKATAVELANVTLDVLAELEAIQKVANGLTKLVAEHAPGILRTVLAGNAKIDPAVKRRAVKALRSMMTEQVFEGLVAESKAR